MIFIPALPVSVKDTLHCVMWNSSWTWSCVRLPTHLSQYYSSPCSACISGTCHPSLTDSQSLYHFEVWQLKWNTHTGQRKNDPSLCHGLLSFFFIYLFIFLIFFSWFTFNCKLIRMFPRGSPGIWGHIPSWHPQLEPFRCQGRERFQRQPVRGWLVSSSGSPFWKISNTQHPSID